MERRRLLDNDGYIEWLKSIGCVLYLPLSYDGDLTDRISGQSLILSGNGSMVWNNAEQMYFVTTPSSTYQYVARLNNGLNNTFFPSGSYSAVQQVKRYTNSSSKRITTMTPNTTNGTTVTVFLGTYNASSTSSGYPSGVAKVATVIDRTNRVRNFYQQGGLYNQYAEATALYPENWVLDGNGIQIGTTSYDNAKCGVSFYLSECYIFNTALDLTTIRKIQGYE